MNLLSFYMAVYITGEYETVGNKIVILRKNTSNNMEKACENDEVVGKIETIETYTLNL